MCGIAGFCDFNKKSNKNTLIEMTEALHHRGPDDGGYSFYEDSYANIGLGHRRLSILDLSSHGHQPMKFENLEIVYNGEVYNFNGLCLISDEFIGIGTTFVTLSRYFELSQASLYMVDVGMIFTTCLSNLECMFIS